MQNRKGAGSHQSFFFSCVFTGTADNFLIKLDSVLYSVYIIRLTQGRIFCLTLAHMPRGLPFALTKIVGCATLFIGSLTKTHSHI